jgi:hypothetical protein
MIFQAKKHLVLIPIFGSTVYVLLYIIATLYYPGGSQIDKNFIGFSWTNNYWCNLLNDTAINGLPNPAKPIAITGMLVLCITLAYFWWLFANRMNLSKKWKYAVRISGTLSMFIAFFLFTDLDHDLVTNLASFFGMIATVGTFIGLYRSKWMTLFMIGLLNILMVCLNNYVYYTKGLIIFLPIIQKLSFAAFLIWICWIDVQIFRLKV